jgi:hypothetical protein
MERPALPAIIAELMQYCQKLESIHVDRWFTENSHCDSRLAKLTDSSMLSLGELFFSILDPRQEPSEQPWEIF